MHKIQTHHIFSNNSKVKMDTSQIIPVAVAVAVAVAIAVAVAVALAVALTHAVAVDAAVAVAVVWRLIRNELHDTIGKTLQHM
jgi:hypothetical protein